MAQQAMDELARDGRNPHLAADRWSLASLLSFHDCRPTPVSGFPPGRRHGRDFRSW